jgi:ABC-2 type transport system ATP-binding protein
MTEFDLAPKRDERVGSLSGGFKQLLSVVCALVHEPSLLFLDEPDRRARPGTSPIYLGLCTN